jgi:hypothetical protein
MTVKTAGDRREPQPPSPYNRSHLGMGHMAAAASAGSANPRYLGHG